jgi:hypothetical protein
MEIRREKVRRQPADYRNENNAALYERVNVRFIRSPRNNAQWQPVARTSDYLSLERCDRSALRLDQLIGRSHL